MRYVDVIVIGPDKREYDARVNADAEDEKLIADLVHRLGLSTVAEDGATPIEYGINLIGSTKITEGATLQLYEVPLSDVAWIRERKKH